MTFEQKQNILDLRAQGAGYKKIASITGISPGTVKSFLRRNSEHAPTPLPSDEPKAESVYGFMLTKEELRNELLYNHTMIQARKLMEHGIIDVAEFQKFNLSMKEKYNPIFDGLILESTCNVPRFEVRSK